MHPTVQYSKIYIDICMIVQYKMYLGNLIWPKIMKTTYLLQHDLFNGGMKYQNLNVETLKRSGENNRYVMKNVNKAA